MTDKMKIVRILIKRGENQDAAVRYVRYNKPK